MKVAESIRNKAIEARMKLSPKLQQLILLIDALAQTGVFHTVCELLDHHECDCLRAMGFTVMRLEGRNEMHIIWA